MPAPQDKLMVEMKNQMDRFVATFKEMAKELDSLDKRVGALEKGGGGSSSDAMSKRVEALEKGGGRDLAMLIKRVEVLEKRRP